MLQVQSFLEFSPVNPEMFIERRMSVVGKNRTRTFYQFRHAFFVKTKQRIWQKKYGITEKYTHLKTVYLKAIGGVKLFVDSFACVDDDK